MNCKLSLEIFERIEGMAGIEAFLVLAVAALNLAVMPWCVRTDQLVVDAPFLLM